MIVAEAWLERTSGNVKSRLEWCANKLWGWSSKRPNDFTKEMKKRRERMKLLMACEPTAEKQRGDACPGVGSGRFGAEGGGVLGTT